MRLVDADLIEKQFDSNTWQGEMMIAIARGLPTAYDVEKVICQLNEVINNVINHERDFISEKEVYSLLLYFVEIIKRGGVDE